MAKQINEDLPAMVSANPAYRNAMANSDRANAKIEHDKALQSALTDLIKDSTELFKAYADDPNFKKWLSDLIFQRTYEPGGPTA